MSGKVFLFIIIYMYARGIYTLGYVKLNIYSAFGAEAPRLWNDLPLNMHLEHYLCSETNLFIIHFNEFELL